MFTPPRIFQSNYESDCPRECKKRVPLKFEKRSSLAPLKGTFKEYDEPIVSPSAVVTSGLSFCWHQLHR